MRYALLAAALFVQAAAPPPPDTEIFLAPLTLRAGAPVVGPPVNITNSPGYDNQPSFHAGRPQHSVPVDSGWDVHRHLSLRDRGRHDDAHH